LRREIERRTQRGKRKKTRRQTDEWDRHFDVGERGTGSDGREALWRET
jgi:hypothetical protein